jgi:hypothetical protein
MGFEEGAIVDKITKFKEFIVKNKVHVIYIAVILLVVLGAYLILQNKLVSRNKIPEVTTIEDTTPTSVASGQEAIGKYEGKTDAADVSHLIDKAVQQQPTAVYITTTQVAADSKAQQMAKADKADYILKQPQTGGSKTGLSQISNNYYAITQEKKHKISVGDADVDSKAYATIAYTNRDMTVTAYSKDMRGIDGASITYTVKKW